MKGLYKKVIKGEYPALPRTYSQELHQIVGSLIQVNPEARINCSQLLLHPAVLRRINDISEVETESLLLQTINFPKKFSKITDHLPKPNFEEDLISAGSKSFILPSMETRNSVLRDMSEPSRRHIQESEKSLQYMKKQRNLILKESYGALRLPKVRYPFKKQNKAPRESTVVPRVKSEKISLKPCTNRSLIAAYRNPYN